MNSSTHIDVQFGGDLQLHITASAKTAQEAVNAAYNELRRVAHTLNCVPATTADVAPMPVPILTPFNVTANQTGMLYTPSLTGPNDWGSFQAAGTSTKLAEPLKPHVASHWLSNSVSCTDGVYAIIATDIDTLRLIDIESGKLLYCAASATLFERIQEVAEYIENAPDLQDDKAAPCSDPFESEWYSLVDWSAS